MGGKITVREAKRKVQTFPAGGKLVDNTRDSSEKNSSDKGTARDAVPATKDQGRMTKKCHKCGEELKKDSTRCHACNTTVADDFSKMWKWVLVVCGGLFLALGLLIYWARQG